jgi:hypothetical protein
MTELPSGSYGRSCRVHKSGTVPSKVHEKQDLRLKIAVKISRKGDMLKITRRDKRLEKNQEIEGLNCKKR